jgi:hypothetical protein
VGAGVRASKGHSSCRRPQVGPAFPASTQGNGAVVRGPLKVADKHSRLPEWALIHDYKSLTGPEFCASLSEWKLTFPPSRMSIFYLFSPSIPLFSPLWGPCQQWNKQEGAPFMCSPPHHTLQGSHLKSLWTAPLPTAPPSHTCLVLPHLHLCSPKTLKLQPHRTIVVLWSALHFHPA